MKERAWTLLEQKDAQLQTLRVCSEHLLPPLKLQNDISWPQLCLDLGCALHSGCNLSLASCRVKQLQSRFGIVCSCRHDYGRLLTHTQPARQVSTSQASLPTCAGPWQQYH